MSREILFVINPETGEVNMEGIGFSGPACDRAMNKVAEELGKVTDRTYKPEHYGVEIRNDQTQGGGCCG